MRPSRVVAFVPDTSVSEQGAQRVDRRARLPASSDDYDPFEEFNRSAGIGVVENPYPMFALVRAEHTIKREDFARGMVPDDVDDVESRC